MIEVLARAMFDRRCDLDGAEPALVELAWADADIRRFWLAEAAHVMRVLWDLAAVPAGRGKLTTAQRGSNHPSAASAEWVGSPTRCTGVRS